MAQRLAPLSKLVGAHVWRAGTQGGDQLLGFDGGAPRPPFQPVGQQAH